MNIRSAENKDIPALLDLLFQIGKVHNDIRPDIFRDHPCKYSAGDLAVILKDSTRPIFVAEEDGKVLGYTFCIFEEVRNDPVLCDQKTLYVDDLCIDREYRGRHIGTALYDYVLEFAKKSGCDTVTLNVWEGNDSARQFYEDKGMRPRKTYMEISCN